jgi:hypothetical protein
MTYPATTSTAEVEITAEMVAAGAAVIWHDSDLDVGASGAEDLAERVIEAALKTRHGSSVAR